MVLYTREDEMDHALYARAAFSNLIAMQSNNPLDELSLQQLKQAFAIQDVRRYASSRGQDQQHNEAETTV